ncbi:MAG TPA: hypothetical protein VI603_08055 [Saprospiraceae bacterium]|nr:hypothetical protein [Saprospiraceae bacterium]
MTSKKRPNIKLIGLCAVLCLSLASYLALQIMESGTTQRIKQEMMAEEIKSGDALPDVQLLKQLMHKTLEFMLVAPRISS